MIRNYFTIALRNLLKNKVYSFINLFGLAIGMGVAILISFWLNDEISFNKYHKNYDRLGRVMTTSYASGEPSTNDAIAIPLAEELRTKYAGDFKKVALTSWNFTHILSYGEKKISGDGLWSEPNLPEMLSLKMIEGKIDALNDPSSVLITESLSKTLFGTENPVNKIIKFDNSIDIKVAGVFEDLPKNSRFFETKYFLSWKKYLSTQEWIKNSQSQWGNHSWQMFAELNQGSSFDKVSSKIKGIPMQHLKASIDGKEETLVHPMSKWHLYSEFKNGKSVGGRITFVWLFGIIGAFVLMLACINFMNLSTARSEKRAKEVGVRKAIGSIKSQLIWQFLIESILVAFISFLLAILFVQLSLNWFNQLSDKQLSIPFSNPIFWLLILGFTLFTGFVSGSYPAFYLSSFEPIKVLKGTFRAGKYASLPRKVLVVLQFTVSIALIIGTIVVFRQIQYAKNRPVGYNREGLISININTPDLRNKYAPLRDDLLKTNVVENMSQSSSPTTGVHSNEIGFDWKGKDPNTTPPFGFIAVTHDFGKTIQWEIKEGRDFSKEFGTDTTGLILNEAAIKLTGLKNPIGETIKWNNKNWHIIGVIKDMVMESPFEPIKPTIFTLNYQWANYFLTIGIKQGEPVHTALSKIEGVLKKYNPGSPFEYKFIDEEYAHKFNDESRIGTLSSVFSGLAILISCLGLFGLASFTAEQRTKEIGVRKVLGASITDLWFLLSKDFVGLVLISLLISMPVSYWFMHNWLLTYPYHAAMSWWIFVFSGFGALTITMATVSFQAIKAALANPVHSLRNE